MFAAASNRVEAIKALIKAGANVKATSKVNNVGNLSGAGAGVPGGRVGQRRVRPAATARAGTARRRCLVRRLRRRRTGQRLVAVVAAAVVAAAPPASSARTSTTS